VPTKLELGINGTVVSASTLSSDISSASGRVLLTSAFRLCHQFLSSEACAALEGVIGMIGERELVLSA
jgi:hypothetical protein